MNPYKTTLYTVYEWFRLVIKCCEHLFLQLSLRVCVTDKMQLHIRGSNTHVLAYEPSQTVAEIKVSLRFPASRIAIRSE